ncbi:MAG: hypothetical protein LBL75_01150 [Rickettsiales bacterium]|nr:hypothetical protein [Rickettsiales bacterium]
MLNNLPKTNPRLKKFITAVTKRIKSPRGLVLALITTYLMGMGNQKIITELSNNKKQEKAKAEIEKFLDSQPNYEEIMIATEQAYDKEIKDLTDILEDDKFYENHLFEVAEYEALKTIWDKLSDSQKQNIYTTIKDMKPEIDRSKEPFRMIQDYYYLYYNRQIKRDKIIDIYEKTPPVIFNQFELETIFGQIDTATNRYNNQGLSNKIQTNKAKLDSLQTAKTEVLRKLKKENEKQKRFADSAYAANKIKR